MPVTLAQAALNASSDIDRNVINEFRKSSFILDRLPFDDAVNPSGSGATLTYGYMRQITQRSAAFRAINSEYAPAEVSKQQFETNLKPLGGSFQIDRVLDGIAAGRETALQVQALIDAARAFFAQSVILGDSAVDANSFDGLSKALAGSTTEYRATQVTDWTAIGDKAAAVAAMIAIDEWLGLLDGPPDVILGNKKALARFKVIAIWADMYERSVDEFGRNVERYGGTQLVDLGARAGSNDPVIPIEARDPDAGGPIPSTAGLTDLYAVRFGMDAFHGVSVAGRPLVQTWLPDFTKAGAVKTGEVELGPVSVALKRTKAAAVFRNVRVQ